MSIDLHLLDYFYTVLHLLIIGFNLSGWIWRKTLRLHFVSILLTALSWFGLGIWYGWGYCPVTEWQWEVKRKLGEDDLPGSFIAYAVENITGRDFSPEVINTLTAFFFFVAAAISVYRNFYEKK